MNRLHAAVKASVDCPTSGSTKLTAHHPIAAPAAPHLSLHRGEVVVSVALNTNSHDQLVSSADGTSSCKVAHIGKGFSSTASAAARYASARHIVAEHNLRTQHSDVVHLKPSEIASQHLDVASKQQHTQQQQLWKQKPATSVRGRHRSRNPEQTTASSHLLESQQRQSGQQLQQQVVKHKRISQSTYFADAVALYRMYARDNSMVHWHTAALGLQQLVPRVRSPLQAQQVWQVAVALQAQPLLKQCARVLGGVVVGLVKVTLRNHDLSILQALIAQRSVWQASFNKRHVDQLLLAAVAADVSLEELQALLDLVAPSTLSNRSYFVLIKSFMARQQFTEAAHCFHQMEVAGLHVTPAMEQLHRELRDIRAGQQNNTAGSQL